MEQLIKNLIIEMVENYSRQNSNKNDLSLQSGEFSPEEKFKFLKSVENFNSQNQEIFENMDYSPKNNEINNKKTTISF